MPVCSICAQAYEDSAAVLAHELYKHRDAHKANKQPWEKHYKAPAADLPYCSLCEIYIGHEATYSHLANPGHLANVALSSSAGQVSQGSQSECSSATPFDDLWEPLALSRRSRVRLLASADDTGRDDDAPQQVPGLPTNLHSASSFSFNICARA